MLRETLLVKKREKGMAFLSLVSDTLATREYLLDCSQSDAQKILDALQTLLDTNSLQGRNTVIAAMCGFSQVTGLYPTQLLIKEPPTTLANEPVTAGGFADVFKVVFQGHDMCFKESHIKPPPDHVAKIHAKEAILWAQLLHPNILPFFGLARIESQLAFVSPWTPNGNLVNYLVHNPHVNRLLLCLDTAAGMEYLHENDIVHGNLKGVNVLIDSAGRAALGGFGQSGMADPQNLERSTQSSMASKGGTIRWQAPELFLGQEDLSKEVCNTKESDIFAWAGVCYEIFTGRIPYYEIWNQVLVKHKVLQGKTPTRPEDDDVAWHKHGLTQQMWGLMDECWAFKASERPNASSLVASLKKVGLETRAYGEWMEGLTMRSRSKAGVGDVGDVCFWDDLNSLLRRAILIKSEAEHQSQGMSHEAFLLAKKKAKVLASLSVIFATAKDYSCLLQCRKPDAQKILDALQTLLDTGSFPDRKQLTAAMRRLSTRTNLYPTQLFLKQPPNTLGDDPVTAGGFMDVYKVVFQGKDMCFKAIRHYTQSHVEHMAKVYAKEAIAWAQLSHPNILPFFGLTRIESQLAFVSPWALSGNLVNYLVHNPHVNRLLLCLDTAAGMEYLHENDIVHGNLKGYNVVIDSFGRAALCDFGLSSTTDAQILKWSMQSIMASKGGIVRWQAPELLVEQDDSSGKNTKESDVYAWASVCYEIFTGRAPYYKISKPVSMALSILRGKTPTRPENSDAAWREHGLREWMWGLMEECWAFKASERPSARAVVARLKENTGPDTREPGEWTDGVTMRSRRGVEAGDVRDVKFWEDLDSLLTRIVPGLKEGNTT